MSNKNRARRALHSEAKKYLDVKSLFPKSDYDGRKPLTDYQAKKVSKELRHLAGVAGGMKFLEKDFVKVKRTKDAKKYIVDSMLPKSSKGILLPGGEKINSGVTIKEGAVFFQRGTRSQVVFPLNAVNESNLEKSIRAKSDYIKNPENVSYIATSSGTIKGVKVLHGNNRWENVSVHGVDAELEGEQSEEDIVELAAALFNKYAAMSKEHATRANGRRAVHPSKWGLSLLIERK